MAYTRIIAASRGAMMARARAPMLAPLAARRPASTFPGDDLDEGGEPLRGRGGPSLRQDWSTYAAVGGVGLLVCTIFYYMTSNPETVAARKQERVKEAAKDAKNKVKEVLPEHK